MEADGPASRKRGVVRERDEARGVVQQLSHSEGFRSHLVLSLLFMYNID
jgi:hypothetical protein